MEKLRGIVLVSASAFAFYKAWTLHSSQMAMLGWGVGVLALAVGVYHLTRKPAQPRR